MPNNFKLTGNVYVSKAGNDSNSGLTPDAPKLTIQSGINAASTGQVVIIGTGTYSENISVAASTITLVADGIVIIKGNGINIISNNISPKFIGISFRNNTTVTLSNTVFYFEKCSFIGITLLVLGGDFGGMSIDKCLFVNTSLTFSGGSQRANRSVSNSIFINSKSVALTNGASDCLPYFFTNNYLDQNSVTALYSSITSNNFNFNNIQGKIVMYTNGAVSGVNSNGVPLTFAQHRIDYPTYNVNSFSSDPKFNNPRLLDFTLQAGSPNVSASSDFSSNIGNTEYAVTYTASSAAFTTNATSQSLDYRGLYYGISGSAVSGSITSGPMFLQWPRVKPMTSINWMGALDFNKTITASFAGNTNVPAYTTYTSASGQAGANPDRLKIAMRFSTQQTQPSTDAEWDNNGYWTAGTYQLFEINQKPTIDYKGTGNGDPTYAGSSAIGDLVPSWIQTQIILRNDYNR